MTDTNQIVRLFAGALPIAVSDSGTGRAYLLLHGGAGPTSMLGLGEALSKQGRVIIPTHPGFAGQPQPDWFHRVDDLALAYLALLERMDAADVVLVGNSFGGWIASEIALRRSPRVSGLVLLNAVGIDPGEGGQSIVNPATLPLDERAAYAFHDPQRFAVVPSTEAGLAMIAANQKAMLSYSGSTFMYDPGLRRRLANVSIASMVIWGESDRIVGTDYGRRFADSIPAARFKQIAEAGHFPHIEKRSEIVTLIEGFSCN
jgi:pimeloyl-ACP methyl ester carboxylesterase